ncbi:MAG: hypothetical protein ABI678_30235, partial [Kofleriaceae bacterium]
MARKGDPVPQDHTIRRATTATPCATCAAPIAENELALAEAYVATDGKWARSHKYARSYKSVDPMLRSDDYRSNASINADLDSRLHHLACAVQHQPYKLRSALKTSADPIPDRARLEATLAEALTPRDAAERDPATRAEYEAFIARLRDSQEPADFLVFGDWLQSAGDPRGELIAIQHALETAVNEDRARLIDAEKKLLALPDLAPGIELRTLKWKRGFVRKVVKPSQPFHPQLCTRPSLRFLTAADFVATDDDPAQVAPVKKRGPIVWRVRHTRKPEWGIGEVLAEDDDLGVEVAFADVVTR